MFASLVGSKYVTDSALSSVLHGLRDNGLLSPTLKGLSRRSLKRHTEGSVLEPTVYGPVFQTIRLPLEGGDFSIGIARTFLHY